MVGRRLDPLGCNILKKMEWKVFFETLFSNDSSQQLTINCYVTCTLLFQYSESLQWKKALDGREKFMEFAHFCLLLLLLMRYNNHENKIDGVATEIVEATSQRLANPDGACKKNIHIVTHLWKRICNFKNIQIIGISSPNAPTIICYLAQDEQVKQQCFKFWSHLILIKRDT